jgi:hypothetical protein
MVEWALYRSAAIYARAMDRNEPALLDEIFTADAVIEAPSLRIEGLAEIRKMPAVLKQKYAITNHSVCNQTVEIAGDRATGETYCLGHLVSVAARGGEFVLAESVRYLDEWSCTDGVWRFTRREIVVDFSEIRSTRFKPHAS